MDVIYTLLRRLPRALDPRWKNQEETGTEPRAKQDAPFFCARLQPYTKPVATKKRVMTKESVLYSDDSWEDSSRDDSIRRPFKKFEGEDVD